MTMLAWSDTRTTEKSMQNQYTRKMQRINQQKVHIEGMVCRTPLNLLNTNESPGGPAPHPTTPTTQLRTTHTVTM